MNAFLSSVKADLLDVRLRLALLILAIALVAAVVYAVLGGGGSSATVTSSTAPISSGAQGIAVSQAPANLAKPVAETTNGSSQQRGGASRDPFTPLPAVGVTGASAKASSGSASGSSASGSSKTSAQTGSPSQGAGVTTPLKPSAPAKPKAPAVVYKVAVLFGVAPPGTPAESLQLTPYENLARLTPLPSAKLPLLVFRGVTTGGKSATFTVVGEVILHGGGTCLPSASQCQAIDLRPGQTEEVEYLPAGGVATTYQLQVVSISSSKASAARAARAFHAVSKVGQALLRRKRLTALPGLRYSFRLGVLVFAGQPASAARVWAVAGRRRRER
jgi:hypothetical protein